MFTSGQGKNEGRIRYKGRLPYVSGAYKNPFFNDRPRRAPRLGEWPRRLAIAAAAGSFCLLAAGAAFLYSGYFTVREYAVDGQGRIAPEDVRRLARETGDGYRWLVVPAGNILAYDLAGLRGRLEARYGFEELSLKRDWPAAIVVAYREKPYSFIVQDGEDYFYIDGTGRVLAEANILEVEQRDYPIIRLDARPPGEDGHYDFGPAFLSAVSAAFRGFKDHEDMAVERFLFEDKAKSVTVKVLGGPLIFFSTEEGIDGQMNKLVYFKEERLGPDFFKKEYLDLRYGSNVYYK